MTEQTRLAKLMTDVMENIHKNKDGMNDGAYSDVMEKLKEKYDELEKEDVLVKKSWKETNYKVKYMALTPRSREFMFSPKSYRKNYLSRICYELKTQIFLGESLSKLFTESGWHWKAKIERGEEFHEVINEKIEECDAIEGRITRNGNFEPDSYCRIDMVVCDSECDVDDDDIECECDKCCDVEIRATPMYILSLEKV